MLDGKTIPANTSRRRIWVSYFKVPAQGGDLEAVPAQENMLQQFFGDNEIELQARMKEGKHYLPPGALLCARWMSVGDSAKYRITSKRIIILIECIYV